MRYIVLVFVLAVLSSTLSASTWMVDSDNTDSLKKNKKWRNTPTFLNISFGLNLVSFRDFATSPLLYRGRINRLEISRLKYNEKREGEMGFSYNKGSVGSEVNNHSAVSTITSWSFYYSRLYQFNKLGLDTSKWNIKLGGVVNATTNTRINSGLGNNQWGFEGFGNILASAKIERNLSRKETKHKKVLYFIKYTLKPRVKYLSFRLNVGLLNSAYRNGFLYASDGLVGSTFSNHHYRLSGFRLSSDLSYTISLRNKNYVRLSYLWDMYMSSMDAEGDGDEGFQMVNHVFALSFLFNTNNK